MPTASVFAGTLPGSRQRFVPKEDDFSKKSVKVLTNTVTWTSRAYNAIIQDALVLDPDLELDATPKLVALCLEVARMMKHINSESYKRTVSAAEREMRDNSTAALNELWTGAQRVGVAEAKATGKRKQDIVIPWETALELLLHIAAQRAKDAPVLGKPILFLILPCQCGM